MANTEQNPNDWEKKNTQTLTEIATEATETCYVQLAEKISLLIFNLPNLFYCKEQQSAQGQVHASKVYTASQNKVQNNYRYRLISASLESSLSEDYHMICKIFISNNITPGDSTGKCKATPEPISWFTQERTCPHCTPKFEQQKEYRSCQLQAYKSQSCCIALSYLVTFLHSSISQIPAKLAVLGVCLPSWFSPCEFSRTLLSSGVIYIPAMPCYLYYRSLPVDEGVLKLEHGNIVRGETSMELFPAASPWAQPSLLLHGPWSTKHSAHAGLPKFTVFAQFTEGNLLSDFIIYSVWRNTLKSPPRPGFHEAGLYTNSKSTFLLNSMPATPVPHKYL